MIKSISYDQNEILQNILNLCNLDKFECDVTFGNGRFYQKISCPDHCFDSDSTLTKKFPFLTCCSSDNLPLQNQSISSLVFDPPFLTYVKAARNHNSIMAGRFGGYWRYDELEHHYKSTIKESHRVLKKGGIMVFKCQDIIHNHKMHATHINVVNWCKGMFRLKDLFILAAKHRMPMPNAKTAKQKHSRIHHSYFLVLERLK